MRIRYTHPKGRSSPPAANAADVERGLLLDQWKQSIDSFQFVVGLMVQVWGFLVAADAILLAYGFAQRLVFPIFIAAGLPLIMAAAVGTIASKSAPVALTAVRAEKLLGLENIGLATHVAMRLNPSLIDAASQLETLKGRGSGVWPRSVRARSFKGSQTMAFFAIASLMQVGLGVLLIGAADWPLLNVQDLGEQAGPSPSG